MPIPANRAKIQLARGNYSNLLTSVTEFAEGELSYAKDENLLYIKEEGELIRLEYVTRADLDAAVEESIDLEVFGGDGLLTENGGGGSSPTTTLSIDEVWLKDKVGITDSKEPAGFVDKTTTVIAYRPVEEQFWLYPTSASAAVWCQGNKHTFTVYKSVDQPTVSGVYYIYLDETATLQIKSTEFNYKLETPVCQVYWNQTLGTPLLLVDRRHGIAMNWATQEFLELATDAVVKDGFTISEVVNNPSGSSNNHSKFALSDGSVLFQDVKVEVDHSAAPASNVASNLFQQILSPAAKVPVLYKEGSEWSYPVLSDYSFVSEAGIPIYNVFNTTWETQPVADGNYFISYITGTGNTEYPIVAFAGQQEYAELSAAEAASFNDLDLNDLGTFPLKVLYKIIYKYNSIYTNTTKVIIDGYQDLRFISKAGGAAVSDHGRLSGLLDDDHSQYVHVSLNRTISANHTHSGSINITNATESVDTISGALVIAGGVGITGNLNVTGDIGATLDGGNF
jgi:hypothetical protein